MQHVSAFATALETSYGQADRIVEPGHPAWKGTLFLIRKYSEVTLPEAKVPKFIGRLRAVDSGKLELENGEIYQWTAPTTPIAIVYSEIIEGKVSDYLVVGTLADLRMWINRRTSDVNFLVVDFMLGALALFIVMVGSMDPEASTATGKY